MKSKIEFWSKLAYAMLDLLSSPAAIKEYGDEELLVAYQAADEEVGRLLEEAEQCET